MRKTYHGSCRCGAVRFVGRAILDVTFGGETLSGEYYAVNVACLDDATAGELAEAPVRYEDGRDDNWASPPAETRHL